MLTMQIVNIKHIYNTPSENVVYEEKTFIQEPETRTQLWANFKHKTNGTLLIRVFVTNLSILLFSLALSI